MFNRHPVHSQIFYNRIRDNSYLPIVQTACIWKPKGKKKEKRKKKKGKHACKKRREKIATIKRWFIGDDGGLRCNRRGLSETVPSRSSDRNCRGMISLPGILCTKSRTTGRSRTAPPCILYRRSTCLPLSCCTPWWRMDRSAGQPCKKQ